MGEIRFAPVMDGPAGRQEGRTVASMAEAKITLLGVPLDANSSHLRGPAKAPAVLRAEMAAGYTHMTAETGVDLGAANCLAFPPDLSLTNRPGDADFAVIEAATARVLASGSKPFLVGGDHSISLPALRAVRQAGPAPVIVHFDAHPDLYDAYEGSPWSHACPFARILEEGLARQLIQIGVRTVNAHQREQITRFGVDCFEMGHLPETLPLPAGVPVYVSFDMDGLDPAFAPGVSHLEPGGLSVRQAIAYLHQIEAPVIGADLVEFNPDRDQTGLTAAVALKLTKEIAGLMAR